LPSIQPCGKAAAPYRQTYGTSFAQAIPQVSRYAPEGVDPESGNGMDARASMPERPQTHSAWRQGPEHEPQGKASLVMNTSINRIGGLTRRAVAITLIIALALLGSATGTAAQATSTLTVGTATLEYIDEWDLLGADEQTAVFQHPTDPFALFQYSELEDGSFPFTDNAELIEVEALGVVESSGLTSDIELVESGTLADDTLWHLYALRVDDVRSFLLVTGNTDLVSGADVLSMLLAPEANVIAAHFAVMDGFTINGDPVPVAQVDEEDVLRGVLTFLGQEIRAASRMPGPPAQPAP
jgi:hypothetical protein